MTDCGSSRVKNRWKPWQGNAVFIRTNVARKKELGAHRERNINYLFLVTYTIKLLAVYVFFFSFS